MKWLTDKEKSILFAALLREKKVCKAVDKEICRQPYEDSLESVCKSLEYKFMYDRLFKDIEKKTRSDICREFAERLKAERTTLYYKFDDEVVDVEVLFWDDVKSILAEMEGE